MSTFYVIDGNSYLHRAYHALPPLATSKGEQINAVFGFFKMVLKIIKRYAPDYIAVCFDLPGATFRHKQFEQYKATRKKMDEELVSQIPISKDVLKALSIPIFEREGYEADDLIASLAEKNNKMNIKTVIVTGDKDTLQLVEDNVNVLNEPKDILYTTDKVIEKYGVKPDQLIDLFALSGDKTDNVPGVPGIGEKTATKLIQEFGNIETIINNFDRLPEKITSKIKSNTEKLKISKELITLDRNIDIEFTPEKCTLKEFSMEKIIPILNRLELSPAILDDLIKSPKKSLIKCQNVTSKKQLKNLIPDIVSNCGFSVSFGEDGIGISAVPLEGYYIPYELEDVKSLDIIKVLLENEGLTKFVFDLKSIYLFLNGKNITLKGELFDLMLASYCLNPTRKSHSLRNLSIEYIYEDVELSDNCKVAEVILRLAKIMILNLKKNKLEKLFQQVEIPLVRILSEMELKGVKIDVDYLTELSRQFGDRIEKIKKEIFTEAGRPFNIDSPKQLAQILFEELKLTPLRHTKTGFSTDEEVLKQLAKKHPLPVKIISYRELQKLKSTYIDTLLEIADPAGHRVHTTFNQTITATGRLSSSNPNLQNIPIRTEIGKKIRRAFIPEKNNIFLSADYSQIDLRVLAHVSGDPVLTDAFNSDKDIHTSTACEIFNVKESDINEEKRRLAKTINFGIIYGMSSYGLAQQLEITQEEASEYICSYFKKYSRVKKWIDEIIEIARKNGYVSTLLNRMRYLPEINSKNIQMRQFAERTAINTPIQGSSADIIKISMIKIHNEFLHHHTGCSLILQVHDELLFECSLESLEKASKTIKNLMEHSVKLSVPLKVDIKTGENWQNMK
ncbi:MAG: DNA polymerase I [Elusimicrobiota bacterium]